MSTCSTETGCSALIIHNKKITVRHPKKLTHSSNYQGVSKKVQTLFETFPFFIDDRVIF